MIISLKNWPRSIHPFKCIILDVNQWARTIVLHSLQRPTYWPCGLRPHLISFVMISNATLLVGRNLFLQVFLEKNASSWKVHFIKLRWMSFSCHLVTQALSVVLIHSRSFERWQWVIQGDIHLHWVLWCVGSWNPPSWMGIWPQKTQEVKHGRPHHDSQSVTSPGL